MATEAGLEIIRQMQQTYTNKTTVSGVSVEMVPSSPIYGLELQYSLNSSADASYTTIAVFDPSDIPAFGVSYFDSQKADTSGNIHYYRCRQTNPSLLPSKWIGPVSSQGGYYESPPNQTPSLDGIPDGDNFIKLADTAFISGSHLPLSQTSVETFSDGYVTNYWALKTGSNNTATVITSSEAAYGGRIFEGQGYQWWEGKYNIPFDPNILYAIKFRWRQSGSVSSGTPIIYMGVAGIGADGTTYINVHGTNSFGEQHYVAVSGLTATTSTQWTESIGYFKGTGSAAAGGQSNDPSNPAYMYTGVKYIRPLFICGYPNAVGGQFDLDYVLLPDSSNAGQQSLLPETKRQLETIYSSDNTLTSQSIQSDGLNPFNLFSGYQTGLAYNGDTITFSTAYNDVPTVILSGGITSQPGSKWGTFAQANSIGSGSDAVTANAQSSVLQSRDGDGNGFTVDAYLLQVKTGAGSLIKSQSFTGGNTVTLTSASLSVDNLYVCSYNMVIKGTYDSSAGTLNSVTLQAKLYTTGSGKTKTYRATDTYTVTAFDPGLNTLPQSGSKSFTVTLANGDKIGIDAVLSTSGKGWTDQSFVDGNQVIYNIPSSTTYQYASMTPDGISRVKWEAYRTN